MIRCISQKNEILTILVFDQGYYISILFIFTGTLLDLLSLIVISVMFLVIIALVIFGPHRQIRFLAGSFTTKSISLKRFDLLQYLAIPSSCTIIVPFFDWFALNANLWTELYLPRYANFSVLILFNYNLILLRNFNPRLSRVVRIGSSCNDMAMITLVYLEVFLIWVVALYTWVFLRGVHYLIVQL